MAPSLLRRDARRAREVPGVSPGKSRARRSPDPEILVLADPPTTEVQMSSAVQQAPGIMRTDLQREDLSVPGREVIQNRVELAPEAPAVRHKHPGEEIIYVLEGSLEYAIDGRAPATYSAGDALVVPPETVHAVRNVGDGNAAELATYVVEKGKPFLVVVD
jgi:quercetin dioxygenase-like cupin family protein